jgi:hypothetical protein
MRDITDAEAGRQENVKSMDYMNSDVKKRKNCVKFSFLNLTFSANSSDPS